MSDRLPQMDGATAVDRKGRTPRRAWEHSPLAPVNARPPFLEYLHQLWDRRHFISMHAYSQAVTANQGTLAGNTWMLLAPLLDGAVYYLIFGVIFGANRGVPDFIPRLIIGILVFSWASRTITSATNAVNGGKGLIRAFSFPRASLPIAAVVRELVSLVPILVTVLSLAVIIPPHTYPKGTWLLIPVPLALMTGFAAGIGFALARLATIVPDLVKLIPYAMRFWMYGSGVVFDIARFASDPTLMGIMSTNPMYLLVECMRELILYGTIPPLSNLLWMVAWAVVPATLGLLYFWRGEATYGRQRVA